MDSPIFAEVARTVTGGVWPLNRGREDVGKGWILALDAGVLDHRGAGQLTIVMILGVGLWLEQQLNATGNVHYDQAASRVPEDVAWVDENLEGFKGRVSLDDWVEQAPALAAGGHPQDAGGSSRAVSNS